MPTAVFVEPNLKSEFGHVYSTALAIDRHLRSGKHWNYGLVGHKAIRRLVRNRFANVLGLWTAGSFDVGTHHEALDSFRKIIRRYNLGPSDLVVVLTAHLNEIRAVAHLDAARMPRVVMYVHQIVPPNGGERISPGVRTKWLATLGRAINSTDRSVCVAASTRPLARELSRHSHRNVVAFPTPLPASAGPGRSRHRLAFLGHGRSEKGLLRLAESLPGVLRAHRRLRVTLQVCNPRGFSESERARLERALSSLKATKRVRVLRDALDMTTYYRILRSSQAVLLPYDPSHYECRQSGIALEAAALGVPVIATHGTIVGHLVGTRRMSGVLFHYGDTVRQFERNFREAVGRCLARRESLRRDAVSRSSGHQRSVEPQRFISRIARVWR